MYSVTAKERIGTANTLVYLDLHSLFDPVILILVSLLTCTVISFSFTCIYGELELATYYELVMKNK